MTTLFFDIETLPQGAVEHRAMMGPSWRDMPPDVALTSCEPPAPVEMGRVPSNWRDPAKIAPKQAELEERYKEDCAEWAKKHVASAWSWWRAGSLDGDRGQIYSIAWAVGDSDPECVAGDDERDVLDRFADAVRPHAPKILVAQNAPFDSGMIFRRALRLKRPRLAGYFGDLDYKIVAKLKLYDRPKLIDTMAMAPTPDRFERRNSGPSMATLCDLLGVPPAANPIGGAEVLDAYMDGRDDEIVAHNIADVRDLRACWTVLADVWGIR